MGLLELGDRVVVIGASGSGKSTLADAIARKRSLDAVHLDQLRHLPGTRWQSRPDAEFDRLHAEAIVSASWVLEGNYSKLLPARLERATGLILLDISVPRTLFRYLLRTCQPTRRIGGIGVRESVSWSSIRYQLKHGAVNRRRRCRIFDEAVLPKVALTNPAALSRFYRDEHLNSRGGSHSR